MIKYSQRFGRLIALYPADDDVAFWHFKCDCGEKKSLRVKDVKSGKSQSCGCLRREVTVAKNKARSKHGLVYKSPTGMSWRGMMARCYNKQQNSYAYYGAIGITVCEFLLATPQNVIELIGCRPEDKTLDRKDNLDGYHCGRCAECLKNEWKFNIRWATGKQQGRNKKSNRMFTINGETKCVTEWAELYGIKRDTIWDRVKHGKSGADLIAPPRK